jgi:hypothetical protein
VAGKILTHKTDLAIDNRNESKVLSLVGNIQVLISEQKVLLRTIDTFLKRAAR